MAKKDGITKKEQCQAQPIECVENLIIVLRDRQVMLDHDLARLYGVETKRLNEQVRRNIERFPEDFMFQLTKEEAEFIKSTHTNIFIDENRSRSQIATLKIFMLICSNVQNLHFS